MLPDSIGSLSQLEVLSLPHNQLSALPASISGLTALDELSVYNNQLTSLPDSIGSLPSLYGLLAANNQLTSLPATIGGLTGLNYLVVYNNQLTTLPAEIGSLDSILSIEVSGNQIETLPAELWTLDTLEILNLSNNRMVTLPAQVSNLTALESLELSTNLLTSVPGEISNLTNLNLLGLAGNRLTALPESMASMTWLTGFGITSNALPLDGLSAPLTTFLNTYAPGWELSQTVPPTSVTVSAQADTSLTLSWTLPTNHATQPAGYYAVGVSTTPGGPYSYSASHQTADKSATSLAVGGLTPTTTTYFVVVSFSAADPGYSPDITSLPSAAVSGTTTAEAPLGSFALQSPANGSVITSAASVTAATWTPSSAATSYTFTLDRPGALADVVITGDPAANSDSITCTATLCTATLNGSATLTGTGVYTWTVISAKSGSTLPATNNPFTFTLPGTPGAPVLVSPEAALTVSDPTPLFTWTANPAGDAITHYRLQVLSAANVLVFNKQFPVGDVCEAEGCALDLGLQIPPVPLPNGAYQWRVSASNAVGKTFSAYRALTISFPAKAELISPVGGASVPDPTPYLTWAQVDDAAEYRVKVLLNDVVSVSSGWQSAESLCDGGTCGWVATPDLANGAYTWRVEARNLTLAPNKSKSAAGSFSVAFPAAPALQQPSAGGTVSTASPVLTWDPASGATDYRVEVRNRSVTPAARVLRQTFPGAQVCTETLCSLDLSTLAPAVVLKDNRQYDWQVQARITLGGVVRGTKSERRLFTVDLP